MSLIFFFLNSNNVFPLCRTKESAKPMYTMYIHLIRPGQILFDSFVQTHKRPFPHITLVFTGGVDHLLGGVYQRQQGALEIVLMQGTHLIGKVVNKP